MSTMSPYFLKAGSSKNFNYSRLIVPQANSRQISFLKRKIGTEFPSEELNFWIFSEILIDIIS